MPDASPMQVLILAVPETAGSALYGMVDVLSAAGHLWHTLVRAPAGGRVFEVAIVSPSGDPFLCGNAIPVRPDYAIDAAPAAPVIILPELWLGPDEPLRGRYPELMTWLRSRHRAGAALYSACSGALMLAESGLLDGCPATSHWGYRELFERDYPRVRFLPEPNLVVSDRAGRIVTAGGTTSWHDLALHIIARYASPGEALRIAKVYLLKWHGEGQLPFTPLVRQSLHADALVRRVEAALKDQFCGSGCLQRVVAAAGVPERTLKRRFKAATGVSLIDYLHNLRVEEAKRLLETGDEPVEAISAAVGYEEASFFRRLFKRCTGLTPGQYRRLFQPAAFSAGAAVPTPAQSVQTAPSRARCPAP